MLFMCSARARRAQCDVLVRPQLVTTLYSSFCRIFVLVLLVLRVVVLATQLIIAFCGPLKIVKLAVFVFSRIFETFGAKNTVNTNVSCASEAQNHGIYDVFLPLVAKITVFANIDNAFVPAPSKSNGSYAVFTMLQDVVFICEKDKPCILRCFCFPSAAKNCPKIAQKRPNIDFQKHLIILASFFPARPGPSKT